MTECKCIFSCSFPHRFLGIDDDLRSRSTTADSCRLTASELADLDLLTFWIRVGCSLSAVKVSIPFCCWATIDFNSVIVACCASTLFWALRGDARFEQIAASLAPK